MMVESCEYVRMWRSKFDGRENEMLWMWLSMIMTIMLIDYDNNVNDHNVNNNDPYVNENDHNVNE